MLPGLSAAGMMMAGNRKPAFRNLAALFAGGADGIMIDLTDQSTLFNDTNGTFPIVNNGDPVGLALDQHKWGGRTLAEYRASQPELVANGNFDTDVSGWNLAGASGTITWQSGRMRITATTTSTPGASRAFTCVVGRWYELSIDIPVAHSNYTSYGIGTGPTSGTTYSSGNIGNAPGSYKRFFKATSTTQYVIVYGPGVGGQYIEVDNISIKEIDGHHAIASGSNRPLWQSATTDVLFDASNDNLMTDFYFRDQGNFISAYFRRGSLSTRAICGAYSTTGTTEAGYLILNSGGIPIANIGNNQLNSGGAALPSAGPYTMFADQHAAQSDLFVDGVAVANQLSPGNMPDAARAVPFLIGAYNNNGAANSLFNSTIKRIVAGQVHVQDTMSAADFHENLIAA